MPSRQRSFTVALLATMRHRLVALLVGLAAIGILGVGPALTHDLLATAEPAGGSPQPTSDPVLAAQLT
jgi:hypothetical protein